MATVTHRYRNVLNPWQTPREIKTQEKFLRQMVEKLGKQGWGEAQIDGLLRTGEAERSWPKGGE